MRRSCALVAFVLGCSAGPSETASTPAPVVEAEQTEGAPTPREEPLAPDEGVEVLVFAEGATPRIDNLATETVEVEGSESGRGNADDPDLDDSLRSYYRLVGGPTTYQTVAFPAHAEALNATLLTEVREVMESMTAEGPQLGRTICRAGVAQPTLVSMLCIGMVRYDRGGAELEYRARHYRVVEDRLERFEISDAVLPALDAQIRRVCRRRWTDRSEDCLTVPAEAVLSFNAGGVLVTVPEPGAGGQVTRIQARTQWHVPYGALSGAILADGPLGAALAAGASTDRVARPPSHAEGHAVSPEGPLATLLHRWAELPEEIRAHVRVAPTSERSARLVTESAEHAEAIAQALGTDAAEPIRWASAPLVPAWMKTRRETSLRPAPDEERLMNLPAGALVIALQGRLGGQDSTTGERDTWAFVSAAPSVSGWAAGNLLQPHESCVPSADAALAAYPEAVRERARRTLLRALLDVPTRRGTQSALALVASPERARRNRGEGVTRVELHALDECTLGRRLVRIDAPRAFYQLGVTRAAGGSGDPLVVIGTWDPFDGGRRWAIHPLARRSLELHVVTGDIEDMRIGERTDAGWAVLAWTTRDGHRVVERTADGYAERSPSD